MTDRKEVFFPLVQRFESALWVSLVCHGMVRERFMESLGWDVEVRNYRYLDHRHQISEHDALKLGAFIRHGAGVEMYEHYRDRCVEHCRALTEVSDQVARIATSSTGRSRAESFELFRQVLDGSLAMIPFLASLVLLQNQLELDLREALARSTGHAESSDEIDSILERALVPREAANFVPEFRDVLRLAQVYRDDELDKMLTLPELSDEWRAKIDDHVRDFGWLGTFTFLNEPYSASDVLRRVQRASGKGGDELQGVLDREASSVEEADRIEDGLKDRQAQVLLGIAREFMHLRFERVDVHWKSEVAVRSLQTELSRSAGIPRSQLIMMTLDELEAWALRNQQLPPFAELRDREKCSVEYFLEDGNHRWNCAPPLERLIDPGIRAKVSESGLQGVTACPGEASGKVRQVMTAHEMYDFNEGDVLVTTMTTPDVMLAIEKASAIVTDEGGILCHASIISRELNTPCVIGTEHATVAFTDGDAVKVDATAGIVTFLNSEG